MFRFAQHEFLYALLALPVIWALFLRAWHVRKRNIRKMGDPGLLAGLMPDISFSRPVLKAILFSLAYVFLVGGIARPQLGAKLETVKRSGVEIIVALDVSNSMLAEDIQPNRLERAKQAISRMVDRMENDRIGLIVFAGDAFVQVPVTSDYLSAKMFLSTLGPDIVPVQGTAIGKAIELAAKSFTPGDNKSKALIIITDGENHEADPVAAAEKAHDQGITIHTIGIGRPEGAPIPIGTAGGQRTYLKDKQGHTVITRLDEKILNKIAVAGGGIYVQANNTSMGLNRIYEKIKGMDQTEMETRVYSDYNDIFRYFIGMALFFLIIEWMILEKKNRFLQRIRLFKGEKEDEK
ncbi:MAG: VWA domain-containing protein [Chlorobi bacterium]|nr:VWA domain-containing protein [Chlorobiota bacterium]